MRRNLKETVSRVLSHDLYWENKTYKLKMSLAQMYHDYHDRDTFDFSEGHVTKNQPMAVPV